MGTRRLFHISQHCKQLVPVLVLSSLLFCQGPVTAAAAAAPPAGALPAPAATPGELEVKLVFEGLDQAIFDRKYGPSTLSALAASAGVQESFITWLTRPQAAAAAAATTAAAAAGVSAAASSPATPKPPPLPAAAPKPPAAAAATPKLPPPAAAPAGTRQTASSTTAAVPAPAAATADSPAEAADGSNSSKKDKTAAAAPAAAASAPAPTETEAAPPKTTAAEAPAAAPAAAPVAASTTAAAAAASKVPAAAAAAEANTPASAKSSQDPGVEDESDAAAPVELTAAAAAATAPPPPPAAAAKSSPKLVAAASSSTGARRLLAGTAAAAAAAPPPATSAAGLIQTDAAAVYRIDTSSSNTRVSAKAVASKLQMAAAPPGYAFLEELKRRGVPYEPTMYVDGAMILQGRPSFSNTPREAPVIITTDGNVHMRPPMSEQNTSGTYGPFPLWVFIAIIILGSLLALLLLVGTCVLCWVGIRTCRKRRAEREQGQFIKSGEGSDSGSEGLTKAPGGGYAPTKGALEQLNASFPSPAPASTKAPASVRSADVRSVTTAYTIATTIRSTGGLLDAQDGKKGRRVNSSSISPMDQDKFRAHSLKEGKPVPILPHSRLIKPGASSIKVPTEVRTSPGITQ